MMTIKRSEKQLMLALETAVATGKTDRHVRNLTSALTRKRVEKKEGRIAAAHKRWATIKMNRAAAVTGSDLAKAENTSVYQFMQNSLPSQEGE